MLRSRRYPEGGKPVALVYPERPTAVSPQDRMRINRRNMWIVPVPDSSLSDTSNARDCFVLRKNSKKFQQFALNYAYNIMKTKVLSGEI